MDDIRIGRTFNTPYEKGCVVASEPDIVGNFDAYDSDGVLCSYSPAMILEWTDEEE